MRPDPVIAGVYPASRDSPAKPAAAVAPYGPVRRLDAAPLVAAAGGPVVDPREQAACLLDGRIDNLDEVAPGPGSAESRLVRAWRTRGDGWLADLRGPFALLLWDAGHGRGVLARDLIGLRPVFLAARGDAVVFASDLQALLEMLARRPSPDELTVARWIANEHDFGLTTLHSGVRRLASGCLLVLEHGRAVERRFADFAYAAPLQGSPEAVAEEIAGEVSRVVARITAGARRPALTLSGGLDSTMLAGVAHRQGRELRAYSAVFSDHDSIDEEALIADVVRMTRMPATRLRVQAASPLRGTLEHLDRWGAPTMAVTASFWPALLRRAASDGVDVLLSGEGGDELFITRYPEMAEALRRGDLRRAWKLVSGFPTIGAAPGRRLRLELLAHYGLGGLLPARLTAERESRRALLRPRWRARVAAHRPPTGWKQLDGPAGWAFTAELFRTYCDGRGIAEHLVRVARTGDVDERHPLLDLDLVRLVMRAPAGYTFSPHRTRPLQRMAMEGTVPDSVRMRPEKSYFSALAEALVDGTERALVAELLGPGARIGAYVRPQRLTAMLAGPQPGQDRPPWALEVLDLIKIESWLRQEEDPAFARELLASGRVAPASAVLEG